MHNLDIVFEWKPLFEKFMKHHHLSGRVVASNNTSILIRHRRTMLRFMRVARLYYKPDTALEVWEHCRQSLMISQLQKSFLSLATLYLMSPTSHTHYDLLVPQFLNAWKLVEHCPEWDLLWLAMLCRARKHTRSFDWRSAEDQIFSSVQRFLMIQVSRRAVFIHTYTLSLSLM
jgi:O-phosphoseryl-tRNA(Cys) synthetase